MIFSEMFTILSHQGAKYEFLLSPIVLSYRAFQQLVNAKVRCLVSSYTLSLGYVQLTISLILGSEILYIF